ncbi:MAG: carbamoyl phosphate synthase small subunit [Oscillospiraceae bacterium]|nr:carbamoyl phosphate synthase small subunit [Oscillospiraceae bacterium]
MKAYLVLQNGAVFEGESFGAAGEAVGEIVFTTGMTGYLETLTDPSYYGQIVLQTFPLIGNYGVIPADFENARSVVKAYIVKHACQTPSNFRSEGGLDAFLRESGITGLQGIDTRAVTKMIRNSGAMNGKIMFTPPTKEDFNEIKAHKIEKAVQELGIKIAQNFCRDDRPRSTEATPLSNLGATEGGRPYKKIALMDFGAKRGIADELFKRGCEVISFPYHAIAEEILSIKPNGIMLSNGPGDPADSANIPIIETIKELQKSGIPMFGICLGHQLMALANGFKTTKLKFGHRGANQAVKAVNSEQLTVNSVYITSQNHGYTVDGDSGGAGVVSFVNVNDGTCEGIDYADGSFSVQFHPEARGGPHDTAFLFDKFLERIDLCAED